MAGGHRFLARRKQCVKHCSMGPQLICDKSTLQALSRGELNVLRRYYSLVVPPVLLMEILGDLKKASHPDECRQEVRVLAEKLAPMNSTVTVEFRRLVLGELSGNPVGMDGRPVLAGGKRVVTNEGKSGMVFETAPENHALLRWQVGEFNEAEGLLADGWRRITQAIDLEAMQRHLRPDYSAHVSFENLTEIAEFVDGMMEGADESRLLVWFLKDAGIWSIGSQDELSAVIKNGNKSLKDLPYTSYCVRTAWIFHFALVFGLITTRATNRVDLEYFYYAPFCDAFSSGDSLHRDLAPHIIPEGIDFVGRDEFKRDLKSLSEWWRNMTDEERASESKCVGPPKNESSFAHQIWTKQMKPGYRDRERLQDRMLPDAVKKMADHVRGLIETGNAENMQPHSLGLDECDFVIVKKTVRLNGPCICGSDVTFADCCGRDIGKE